MKKPLIDKMLQMIYNKGMLAIGQHTNRRSSPMKKIVMYSSSDRVRGHWQLGAAISAGRSTSSSSTCCCSCSR